MGIQIWAEISGMLFIFMSPYLNHVINTCLSNISCRLKRIVWSYIILPKIKTFFFFKKAVKNWNVLSSQTQYNVSPLSSALHIWMYFYTS